jgi:hAT family C-terminal dimerisation region
MVAGMYLALTYSITPISDFLQNNGVDYPTLCCIAIDYLACQASSVACEWLFSGGGEIATKRHAQLGATRFKELQIMKFAWRNNIGDLAAWNLNQVEEIDDEMKEYRDMLVADGEQAIWDDADAEVVWFEN